MIQLHEINVKLFHNQMRKRISVELSKKRKRVFRDSQKILCLETKF